MHGANGSRMEKCFTSWKTDFTLETLLLLRLRNVTMLHFSLKIQTLNSACERREQVHFIAITFMIMFHTKYIFNKRAILLFWRENSNMYTYN